VEALMIVEIDKIKVKDRIREEVGEVDKLAISINKYGLFHPIVVKPLTNGEFELVAGFRRIEAHKLLKRNEIEVK
jgi:ParB family chromosome partitioning protein